MTFPKISFLITHYNRPHDLKLCIESIEALAYENYEIIVSDDNSKTKNFEQIKKMRALRIYTSWIFYNSGRRYLITYYNKRKKSLSQ